MFIIVCINCLQAEHGRASSQTQLDQCEMDYTRSRDYSGAPGPCDVDYGCWSCIIESRFVSWEVIMLVMALTCGLNAARRTAAEENARRIIGK